MEIYWDHPEFPQTIVSTYEIRMYSGQILSIPSSQSSAIDYNYTCGSAYYTVSIKFKNNESNWFSKQIHVNTPEPALYFEDKGLDQLMIRWDKTFANAKFNLNKWNESPFLAGSTDTSMILSQSAFGETITYQLTVIPEKGDDPYSTQIFTGHHILGTKLDLPNFPEFSFNKNLNMLFTSSYSDIVGYNADKMDEVLRKGMTGHIYNISCAPNKKLIAIYEGNDIFIYSDLNFVNPVLVRSEWSSFQLSDQFLFTFTYDNVCSVYGTETGTKLYSFQYVHNPGNLQFERCISISSDSKYFSCCSTQGIEIFELTETGVNRVYTDARYYHSVMFHPTQPDVMVVKERDNMEIWSVPDFTIKGTTLLASATLYNIDPVTGYVLYRQKNKLNIAMLDQPDQPLLSIPYKEDIYDHARIKLYNQMLVSSDNVFLNTQKYLNL